MSILYALLIAGAATTSTYITPVETLLAREPVLSCQSAAGANCAGVCSRDIARPLFKIDTKTAVFEYCDPKKCTSHGVRLTKGSTKRPVWVGDGEDRFLFSVEASGEEPPIHFAFSSVFASITQSFVGTCKEVSRE